MSPPSAPAMPSGLWLYVHMVSSNVNSKHHGKGTCHHNLIAADFFVGGFQSKTLHLILPAFVNQKIKRIILWQWQWQWGCYLWLQICEDYYETFNCNIESLTFNQTHASQSLWPRENIHKSCHVWSHRVLLSIHKIPIQNETGKKTNPDYFWNNTQGLRKQPSIWEGNSHFCQTDPNSGNILFAM